MLKAQGREEEEPEPPLNLPHWARGEEASVFLVFTALMVTNHQTPCLEYLGYAVPLLTA